MKIAIANRLRYFSLPLASVGSRHNYFTMSKRLSNPESYEALLNKYDTWLFDCDGVLWRGDHLIEGVIDVLAMLRRRSMSMLQSNRL